VKTNLVIFLTLALSFGVANAQDGNAPAPVVTEAPAPAPAQTAATPAPQSKPVKKGKVSVSFDDELVKGATSLPEGDVISSRLENRFKRFIKVRKDFIQDVENTKDEFGHK
jgi:hypothetical protein